jgi:hypothetical protein
VQWFRSLSCDGVSRVTAVQAVRSLPLNATHWQPPALLVTGQYLCADALRLLPDASAVQNASDAGAGVSVAQPSAGRFDVFVMALSQDGMVPPPHPLLCAFACFVCHPFLMLCVCVAHPQVWTCYGRSHSAGQRMSCRLR